MGRPVLTGAATQAAGSISTLTPAKTLVGPQADPTRSLKLMQRSVQQIQGSPLMNGKAVTQSIPAGATKITLNHGLGYQPTGCMVIWTAQPLLVTMPGGEQDATKTLNLAVNAGGFQATFWVF